MRKRMLAGLVLVAFLAGCAALGLRSWEDLSPKQKVIYFERVWLSTAQNTDLLLKDPKATDVVRRSAQADKEVLTKLYPLIIAYRSIVEGGGIPSVISEQMIFDLIDQLVNKL